MNYKCSECGKVHEDFPAIGYKIPYYYHCLSEKEKEEMASIDSDTCVVNMGEETHRFIRGVMIQKVNDRCQDLEYGVWVSLSEKSFNDYLENWENEDHKTTYFGWLNTFLPEYEIEEMESIKTNVITRGKGNRPLIEVQFDEENQSRFLEDYHNGIKENEAIQRIEKVMNR